jgi:hypothetical protein
MCSLTISWANENARYIVAMLHKESSLDILTWTYLHKLHDFLQFSIT